MPASVKVVPASDGKASSSSSGDDLSSAIGRPASRTKVCGWSGSMDSAAQAVLHTPSKLDTRIVFVKVFIFSPQLKITPLPTFEVAGGRNKGSMAEGQCASQSPEIQCSYPQLPASSSVRTPDFSRRLDHQLRAHRQDRYGCEHGPQECVRSLLPDTSVGALFSEHERIIGRLCERLSSLQQPIDAGCKRMCQQVRGDRVFFEPAHVQFGAITGCSAV